MRLFLSAQRNFGSSLFKSHEYIGKLPYEFQNTKASIYPYGAISETVQKVGQQMLKSKKFELDKGFEIAYKSLLYSIVEGNEPMIDNFCEYHLSESIVPTLEKLSELGYVLQIINDKNHSFEMEVADMNQVIGAHIDRRRNVGHRRIDMSQILKNDNAKLFKVYVPKGIRGSTLPMNVEMVLKIKTNLKLNIIDPHGNALIHPDDYSDEEIHFVRFESVFNEIEMNFSALMNIRNKLNNPDIEFESWTITDFDRFLFDNSHVPK